VIGSAASADGAWLGFALAGAVVLGVVVGGDVGAVAGAVEVVVAG
jgi:hypothetical protein